MDDTMEEALVYIGASRAVTSLTIIGRESFLASLNPGVATSN
jgi:ATP-dependent exoDNAse (exonuclease V) alpha subunit